MTNFIQQTQPNEHTLTLNSSGTPEASRRYMQWKEDDVGLLLTDLEQPGHYDKWKQNKSGYSKRVAEEVFKSAMYHEAIKFKVRWLESRFKVWHQTLTAPDIIHDEQELANSRDKMMKEFPYYDRCKGVFDTKISYSSSAPAGRSNQSSSRNSPSTDSSSPPSTTTTPTANTNTMKRSERIYTAQEPNSPTLNTPKPETLITSEKRVPIGGSPTNSSYSVPKKRRIQPYTSRQPNILSTSQVTSALSPMTAPAPPLPLPPHSQPHSTTAGMLHHAQTMDSILDDRKLRVMELELEGKKMDHEERMQHMKLEQLRLEIELQKLKRFSSNQSD